MSPKSFTLDKKINNNSNNLDLKYDTNHNGTCSQYNMSPKSFTLDRKKVIKIFYLRYNYFESIFSQYNMSPEYFPLYKTKNILVSKFLFNLHSRRNMVKIHNTKYLKSSIL